MDTLDLFKESRKLSMKFVNWISSKNVVKVSPRFHLFLVFPWKTAESSIASSSLLVSVSVLLLTPARFSSSTIRCLSRLKEDKLHDWPWNRLRCHWHYFLIQNLKSFLAREGSWKSHPFHFVTFSSQLHCLPYECSSEPILRHHLKAARESFPYPVGILMSCFFKWISRIARQQKRNLHPWVKVDQAWRPLPPSHLTF